MSATHQQSEPSIGPRPWQPGTILNAGVLEPVYELNSMFLSLLAAAPRYWSTGVERLRLPDPILLQLMSLDTARRSAVARCPFSLFGARFHDTEWWTELAQNATVHESAPEFDASDPGRANFAAFVQLALFYAWHLAHSNARAARVVLGMSDRTLVAFRSLPLARLQRLASEQPELLTPRWRDRPRFWVRLLAQPAENTASESAAVRLLGVQLLAAELAALQPGPLSVRRTRRP